MKEVQDEAENASKIDDTKNYERELQIAGLVVHKCKND